MVTILDVMKMTALVISAVYFKEKTTTTKYSKLCPTTSVV